jgi:hypothetical protein
MKLAARCLIVNGVYRQNKILVIKPTEPIKNEPIINGLRLTPTNSNFDLTCGHRLNYKCIKIAQIPFIIFS